MNPNEFGLITRFVSYPKMIYSVKLEFGLNQDDMGDVANSKFQSVFSASFE